MIKTKNLLFPVLIMIPILFSGCATWSSSQVDNAQPTPAGVTPTHTSDIIVSENDITDRKYKSLGDITATVNKTTIFNADPTRDMVADKLREEAAKLGADAVILVRYGNVGISFMSWGSLEGKGRAVKFTK